MKIVMPCNLTIESSIELALSTPKQICSICENFDCKKRLGIKRDKIWQAQWEKGEGMEKKKSVEIE